MKNGDLYVGSAENVEKRLIEHNLGKVISTKGYRPWELLGKEGFSTRSEAFRREMFYKTGQQKELLKKKYGGVAKW